MTLSESPLLQRAGSRGLLVRDLHLLRLEVASDLIGSVERATLSPSSSLA